MFRLRQQNEAVIELLPDTPPVSPPPKAQTCDTAALLTEATRGTAAARQILSTANEAHTIAVETADRLQQQTKQLENVVMLVDDTRGHLDSTEVIIEKLTRPLWRRKLGGKKGTERKGSDRTAVFARVRRKEKENVDVVERRTIDVERKIDSYDDFDGAVRDELRMQDELLTDTAVVVEELRVLAIGIGEEIEKEAEIVEDIDIVEVTGRIRENNRKLRTRLKLK